MQKRTPSVPGSMDQQVPLDDVAERLEVAEQIRVRTVQA
jgi:hypothetical protein